MTSTDPENTAKTNPKDRSYRIADFNFIATIGGGSQAKTLLAETKADKQLRAIRAIRKEPTLQNNEVSQILCQKQILSNQKALEHPFIVTLYSTFQNESWLFFVTEFLSGGDLSFHIQTSPFEASRARFYTAEISLALEFLHSQHIIHRGISLENLLLTADGHIKLIGFGYSKQLPAHQHTTKSFTGTAEFMAPEILLDKEYSFPIDWWALGVVAYQMLLQRSPFRGEDEDDIYNAILAKEPEYAATTPETTISLLRGLLRREPERRLRGQDVKEHPFFAGLDWETLYRREVTPPFKPAVTAARDISNFGSEWTSKGLPALDQPETVLSESDQRAFEGF